MTQKITFLMLGLLAIGIANAQSVQQGPYTITLIGEGVYHIEDANDSNPPGAHLDENGVSSGTNNCSDMYLVLGSEKGLLIDLSNTITWDNTATQSLRSIVYERVAGRDLFITVTHSHGDHLGMLPAFVDDENASFWIPEAEFSGREIFPEGRTTFFKENASIELGGGTLVNTMEIPGHTLHSTIFIVKDQHMMFTGDAIGSGSGVWLFNYDSFITYCKSIENLISYINDPSNGIDPNRLVIYGGHYWQRGELEKLTAQYVYDMQTLIERMGQGTAEAESMSSFVSFLDTNFKYGTATITWNKEAAEQYAKTQ